MIRRVVLGPLPFLIHLTQQPRRSTQWRQSLRSLEFTEAMAAHLFFLFFFFKFSLALCHKACVFRGLSLFSFEKNKTNFRQKKKEALCVLNSKSHSFTFSRQGDFLRHFPFACGCQGRSCDLDDKGYERWSSTCHRAATSLHHKDLISPKDNHARLC